MRLKDLLNRTQEAEHRTEERGPLHRKGYTITFPGSSFRALLLLPMALFGLFITLLSILPFLLKVTWRLARFAGQTEQVYKDRNSRRRQSEDFIDI